MEDVGRLMSCLHINFKEVGATFFLTALRRAEHGKHVRIMSDNQTTVAYIRKQSDSHCQKANGIAWKMVLGAQA